MAELSVVDGEGDSLRQAPTNYEAERALLGAILMSNRAYERVADFLLPEHFADPVNGRIFQTCVTLINSGTQANPVTLKSYLQADDLLKAAGGMKYIAALAAGAVTVINAGDYGRIIHDMAQRRDAIVLCEDIKNEAFAVDPEETAAHIIEQAISGLADILGTQTETQVVPLGTSLSRAVKRHEKVDRGEVVGLSSGLVNLDRAMGLMEPGDLVVLAGRPSMGKSSLLLTMLYHVATFFRAEAQNTRAKPKHVVFFSQEMTADEGADRIIAALTGIEAPRRRANTLQEQEWAKILEVEQSLSDLPLLIDPRPRATLSHMRMVCRKLQRQGGIGAIGVDYLQIMAPEKGKKFDNRTAEVGYFAAGLKDLAKELQVPVIALSQLNRGVEQREDKRPNLSDLRESGAIEQAADVVGFVFREQYYLERNEPQKTPETSDERFVERHGRWQQMLEAAHGKAEVILGKARHGTTGTAHLEFDGARTWFSDPVQSSLPLTNAMPDGRPEPPQLL